MFDGLYQYTFTLKKYQSYLDTTEIFIKNKPVYTKAIDHQRDRVMVTHFRRGEMHDMNRNFKVTPVTGLFRQNGTGNKKKLRVSDRFFEMRLFKILNNSMFFSETL